MGTSRIKRINPITLPRYQIFGYIYTYREGRSKKKRRGRIPKKTEGNGLEKETAEKIVPRKRHRRDIQMKIETKAEETNKKTSISYAKSKKYILLSRLRNTRRKTSHISSRRQLRQGDKDKDKERDTQRKKNVRGKGGQQSN